MYFIEHLTLLSWLFYITPLLIKKRTGGRSESAVCYYWDASKAGLLAARIMAVFAGVSIEKLEYRIQDVRDEKGMSTFLQVMYLDSIKMQSEIKNDDSFLQYIKDRPNNKRFPLYLEKSLNSYDLLNTRTYNQLLNALLMIRITAWKSSKIGISDKDTFLFIRRRIWFKVFQRDASRHGIKLIALQAKFQINYKKIIRSIIPRRILNILFFMIVNRSIPKINKEAYTSFNQGPRISTEYYGHLNLEKPGRYSDLFFLQRSDLKGKDVLMMFNLSSDPLDKIKYEELKRHGVEPIVLSPNATKLSYSTVYNGGSIRSIEKMRGSGPELRWMNRIQADYHCWRSYWTDLFERFNVRLYTSWLKYDTNHLAIADAMESLGGVTTIYQRSYQSAPIPSTTINVDIEFGFSTATAKMESLNGSNILYHVTTGYFGDHRFSLLREQAKTVREFLTKNGADHIMAYFDENTVEDSRWYLGNEYAMGNYAFLFQKVLDDDKFGLVLKPKNPGSLIRRLGVVTQLMEEARATGRCYIFMDGAIQGSDPPALAALSADIAVHDGITSPTAGMESAFCGIPTLLLDNEGWPISELYKLGTNKVVFNNWENLWEAYRSYRNSHENIPGFGDWSTMLDEIDPFRDGRAAERIGTYLKWLLDGFQSGLNRETVMADAAERYCKQWGYDKITAVS